MRIPVVTLVTLFYLIGYSASVGSYDAEGVRELLAKQREELKEELTVILKQEVETLHLRDKALVQELELQKKANVELQATVYSLLKAVS